MVMDETWEKMICSSPLKKKCRDAHQSKLVTKTIKLAS